VEVLDLNDNVPEFEADFYNISIVENLPTGFSVLQVNAPPTAGLSPIHGCP